MHLLNCNGQHLFSAYCGSSPDQMGAPKRGAWAVKTTHGRTKEVDVYLTHCKGRQSWIAEERLSAQRQWIGAMFKGGR